MWSRTPHPPRPPNHDDHNIIISYLQDGQSPLQYACAYGHTGTVKVLLEMKAEVNLQDNVR